jgi:hypothetical protein
MTVDWRDGMKRILLAVTLSLIVLVGLYLLVVFNWSFSDGDRVGYLQKFSHKGWICKTYEGELAMTTVPGLAPVIWNFSVWDETVASQINTLLGKKVVMHYREFRGIPTGCFGTTDYFVDHVELAKEQ